MNKLPTKKLLVIVLILGPVLLLSYWGMESHIAKDKAESICNDIKLQFDVAETQKVLERSGIPELSPHPSLGELAWQPHYSFPRPDIMVASVPSAFGERWVCGVRFKDGKAIRKEVRLVQ
jgi:hypothetical protein